MSITLVSTILIGYLAGTSGFINIPTATQYDIPGMFGVGFAYSLTMFSEDPDPTDGIEPDPSDYNMFIRYGLLGRGELALSMYTTNTYALSFSYTVIKEGNGPALFVGIDNITYAKYVSSLGQGDTVGFLEEIGYTTGSGGRPPEMFSAYIGVQKNFGNIFNVVVGLGRGRFVGYGERSRIFNTDLFVLGEDYLTEEHSSWAFGLFFGASLRFPFGLEMSAEMDGRDASVGIKYHNKYVTPVFAITKVEQFGDRRPFSPRIAMGIEATTRFIHEKPKFGTIECVVQDDVTKQLIPGATVEIAEMNKAYNAAEGTFSIGLQVGSYTITVTKPDYISYVAKISVKPDVRSRLVFNLQKTEAAIRREAALYERATAIQTHLEQGKIYFAEGNIVQAKAAFEIVLSLNPDHAEAQDYLNRVEVRRAQLIESYSAEARRYNQAKNYVRAIQSWQQVLALDPNSTAAKNGIVEAQQATTAAKTPEKPAKPAVSEAEIDRLYRQGVTLFTSERYDEALNVFKQVLAHNPNHVGAKEYRRRTEARIQILKGTN
ncbi:MAG: tetratricopeptide repeat protein [Dehalococcoidia bacterium]|nr:tetratricopeptide repeat protein [Dehalococcoidia bacterium]